jgi:hypothetical protein
MLITCIRMTWFMMALIKMDQLRIGKYINRQLPDLIWRKGLTYIRKIASIENRPFGFGICININSGEGERSLNWYTVNKI